MNDFSIVWRIVSRIDLGEVLLLGGWVDNAAACPLALLPRHRTRPQAYPFANLEEHLGDNDDEWVHESV